MPLLYSEGAAAAFLRLQEQIVVQRTGDLSIFAWNIGPDDKEAILGAFAGSPSMFRDCKYVRAPVEAKNGQVSVSGSALELTTPAYNTPSAEGAFGAWWAEDIHLDLNLIECSQRTGDRPLWVTVPMRRAKDARNFQRSDCRTFEYYPTRSWLHTMKELKNKIYLRKTARDPEFSMGRSAHAMIKFDDSMQKGSV